MIAGTLEIQLLANMARLQKDMDDAKRSVGGAMSSIESAVSLAKTALVAFAGVASANAFKDMIKGSIEATAGLHDMAIQTGASVAALAALKSVAATSNTSIEGIAQAMNKGAKAMAVANEDSKGVGQAIKAIGLDFNTLKGMKPEDQMVAIAKALDGFQDGAGKSAVAMTIWGKEGAKMLPFMKDLADESDAVAKKLTAQQVAAKAAQAAMADDFTDNLVRIKKASDAWKKDISMAMLPALYELSQAFIDVNKGAGGIKDGISKLSNDGSITEWSRDAAIALTYVMDGFAGVKRSITSTGTLLGGSLAIMMDSLQSTSEILGALKTGRIGDALAANEAGIRRQRSILAGMKEDLSKSWTDDTFGQQMRARMEALRGVAAVAKEAKKGLDFSAPDGSKKAAAEVTEYQKLMRAISEKTAAERLDAQTQGGLTEGQKFAIKAMDDMRAGVLKLTQAEAARLGVALQNYLAIEAANKLTERISKADLEAAQAHSKYVESLVSGLEKLKEENLAQQESNERLGLGKEAIAVLNAARLESKAITLELLAIKELDRNMDLAQYNLYKAQAEELRKRGALEKAGAAKQTQLDDEERARKKAQKIADELHSDVKGALSAAFRDTHDPLQAFGDALANVVFTRVTNSLAEAMATQLINAATSSGLLSMFGFANGGAFASAPVTGFASGGAFHNSVLTSPTPFRFASGGAFSQAVAGEAGPEVVMPLTRGADGSLGVRAAGAGASPQVINININAVVGDVASKSDVVDGMRITANKIAATFSRSNGYGGARG